MGAVECEQSGIGRLDWNGVGLSEMVEIQLDGVEKLNGMGSEG